MIPNKPSGEREGGGGDELFLHFCSSGPVPAKQVLRKVEEGTLCEIKV